MLSLRNLAEKVTRKWVYRRRLPMDVEEVSLFVSPSAGLRYLFRSMANVDPVLLSLVKEFVAEDATVWDVGANVGLFSFAASLLAGRNGSVIAFEPDVWLVQLLRRSVSLQPSSSAPVTVVPAAVASRTEPRDFCLARRSRAANYVAEYGTPQSGGARETQTVLAVSLDWFLPYSKLPDVIKIDVEGAEREVLAGAVGVFERANPIVICEVGEDAKTGVTEFFHSRGYQLFDGDKPSDERVPLAEATWTTIAMPSLKGQ